MSDDTRLQDLTLAQQFMLLALDDEKGSVAAGANIDSALAGALLLELMTQDSLTVQEGKLRTGEPPRGDDALAAEAYRAVAARDGERDAKAWVERLPRELKPLKERVAESLVERGVLEERRGKTLGLFSRTRWPEIDPGPERALRERLGDVLAGGAEPEPREALLIGLLEPFDLAGGLVSKPERKEARRRAKELAEGNTVSGGLQAGVDEATMVAVNASLVAATATTVNSGS